MATHFALLFGLVLAASIAQAQERSTLARVTAYWREEGQLRAASNGVRLRNGHCAVDPKKIPYGSKIILADEELIAVDTGPAVVNRRAARASGRNKGEKEALVIDHYFETKAQALAWEKSHTHFMRIQIIAPGKAKALADNVPARASASARRSTLISPQSGSVAQPNPALSTLRPVGPTLWHGRSIFAALAESSAEALRSARRRSGGYLPLACGKKSLAPLERLRLSWLQIG